MTGIEKGGEAAVSATFRQTPHSQRYAAHAKVGTADAIVRVVMKNTFFAILAVVATASITQAAESQPNMLPEFRVTPQQHEFIDKRLEQVVHEQIAESLANPIPEAVIADANAKAQPRARFALAKEVRKAAPLEKTNS